MPPRFRKSILVATLEAACRNQTPRARFFSTFSIQLPCRKDLNGVALSAQGDTVSTEHIEPSALPPIGEAFGKTFLNEVLNFRNVINAPPETTGARTRRRKLGAPGAQD